MLAEKCASTESKKRVCVVVLGDFGRSPRMQYHAISLSKNDFEVDVVAYKGTQPCEQIYTQDGINLHYMRNVPVFISSFPKLFRYILKTLWQSFSLFLTLLTLQKIDCIFLQNPPSVPTLPICWLVCCLRKSKLFVDFHNYGYTIMGLTAGKDSLLVRFAKWCEKYFSHKADLSICVTKAMQSDLGQHWDIRSSVFYDCAPDIFRPLTLKEKHAFFMEMGRENKQFQSNISQSPEEERNLFTRKVGKDIELLPHRPALVVSSTSWTEDEDFSILLKSLVDYEKAALHKNNLPPLIVCITGKGPLKSFYEEEIAMQQFSHIKVLTLWLKFEDYPKFLACADLGISLHNSSSGLDLPMKVVDMFGCCLPVCAVAFNCIDELVKDGQNGTLFSNSQQLSQQLQTLFSGFPKKQALLTTFRKHLEQSSSLRWDQNWDRTVLPLFNDHV